MNKHMYLVTGAAGFLGGTVCRPLEECKARLKANEEAAHRRSADATKNIQQCVKSI